MGFARYTIDARPLALELAAIDERIDGQTTTTLAVGATLIVGVMLGAALALHRAQRTIAERNERLARTHFELTLAATNRARQITAGSPPMVEADRDKPTVIALREVAAGKVGIEMLLKPQS